VCQESVIIWSKFDTPTTRNLDTEVGQDGGDEERYRRKGRRLVHTRWRRFGKAIFGWARKGESRRESRRGVSSYAKYSWTAFTESARSHRNRFHSSWAGQTEAPSEVYVYMDGRSLAGACKGLWTQSGRRTGSSKALQQQAKEMTANSLISFVCQATIRRISSISKIRWGIFGCVAWTRGGWMSVLVRLCALCQST
jgi:hypothetical protein